MIESVINNMDLIWFDKITKNMQKFIKFEEIRYKFSASGDASCILI